MSDDGAFLGEAGSVLFFLGEQRERNEKREIGVDVAGGLETVVEFALHLFPDGVAVRLDDHATAHGGMFGEIGAFDNIEVPLRIVLAARCDAVIFCEIGLSHSTLCVGENLPKGKSFPNS